MLRVRTLSMLMLCTLAVAACGQRGDLYMPQAQREAVITVPTDGATLPVAPTTPPATQPADSDDEAETVQPPAL